MEYIILGAGTSPLMSTGCLAPQAPMVIPGSQYSNFTFIIFIVIIYYLARMSTNKDCCCCCCHQDWVSTHGKTQEVRFKYDYSQVRSRVRYSLILCMIYQLKVKAGSRCCYEIQFFILVHAMSSEFTCEVVKSSVVQVSFSTQYNVLIYLQELYQFNVGKTLIRPRQKSVTFQSKIYCYYPCTNTNLILKMVAGMTIGITF